MAGGTLKGGFEEGMPLTENLMKPNPNLVEPTANQAFAAGVRSGQMMKQGLEGYGYGYDFRNFRRGSGFSARAAVRGK